MATATTAPVLTESERREQRKSAKAARSKAEKDLAERGKVGRELSDNLAKILGFRDDAARAVVLGKPTEAFDEARRKLEDRNGHLRQRMAQLSNADAEIAKIDSRLRDELASRELRAEMHVSQKTLLWSDKRRDEASKSFDEAERRLTSLRPEGDRRNCDPQDFARAQFQLEMALAECAEAGRLHAEATADLERARQELLDE